MKVESHQKNKFSSKVQISEKNLLKYSNKVFVQASIYLHLLSLFLHVLSVGFMTPLFKDSICVTCCCVSL